MKTCREVSEAIDVRAVMDTPWKFSAAAYQAALGVHEPWIAEISPMQYAAMGKRAKAEYDKKRTREWGASEQAKKQWRQAVEAAYRDGKFNPKDPDVHPEAEDVTTWLKIADRKAAAAAVAAEKSRANEITDIGQVKKGDQVFVVISGTYGEVLKVSQKSVQVSGRFGPMKVEVNPRSPMLLWKAPRDLHGEETSMRKVKDLIAEMAEATRARKSKGDFVFPEDRRWPIKPKKYAIAAIQYMVMGRGDSKDYPAVKKAIKAEYGDDSGVMDRLKKA